MNIYLLRISSIPPTTDFVKCCLPFAPLHAHIRITHIHTHTQITAHIHSKMDSIFLTKAFLHTKGCLCASHNFFYYNFSIQLSFIRSFKIFRKKTKNTRKMNRKKKKRFSYNILYNIFPLSVTFLL